MASQYSKKPLPPPSPLPAVSPALFQHRRFWLKVAAFRPLLVLAGIWIILLMVAVAAYDRLMYTVEDTPQVTAADTPVYPHERRNPSAADGAPPSTASEAPASSSSPSPDATDSSSRQAATISPGWLGALVATCALGCYAVSQQLQAPPRTPHRRPKRRPKAAHAGSKSPKPPSSPSKAVRPAAASPKRLDPYDPSQPLVVTPQGKRPAQATAKAAQPGQATDVTVVPDDTLHPLDWPEDSLVNSVDVRRQRSLSSFL